MTTKKPAAPWVYDHLRGMLPRDSRVLILITRVLSGDSRYCFVVAAGSDGPVDITGYVAQVTGFRMSRDRSEIHLRGGGMDMRYHLLSSLSHALYADDDALMLA
jgi:hypothetical protein